MHNIEQLRTIRDEALGRLQANPDYKLLTSLDSLITELEGISAIAELAEKSVFQITPEKSEKPATKSNKSPENGLDASAKANSNGKDKNDAFMDLSNEINGGVSLS